MSSSVFGFSLLLASSLLLAQSNPVPFVNQPLVPSAVAPGGPSFVLTVNGTGFVSGSTVNWNGTALATIFVSSSQLTATVPATNIVDASTTSITVVSPTPGGGTSSALFLPISNPTSLQFTSLSINEALFPVTPPLVADFNGDGKMDFAVSQGYGFADYPVTLLVGSGDGTFQSFFDSASDMLTFGAGDFNRDGKLDLAGQVCGAARDCYLNFSLGNGDGTFYHGASVPVPFYPISGTPMIGDFNGDGNLDVALIGANYGLYVYLGNGDGTVQTPVISNPTTPYLSLKGIGDFNDDGKLDLIGFNANDSNDVAYFQGNGGGTFQTPTSSFVLGGPTTDVVAADLNGDGKLDLITVQTSPTNTFTVLSGNGDGTFNPQAPVAVTGSVGPFATIADLNSDGKLDLILTTDANTLVLPGNGDGTFQNAALLPAGDYTGAGDFNNDGKLDMVLATATCLIQEVPVSSATPADLTFATQTVGTRSTAQITTLSNIGSAPLSLTLFSLTGANASDFAETNTCGSSLAENASCQIDVTFTPSAGGDRHATLTVANDGLGTNPTSITLSGTGYVPPLPPLPPSLSPATITFPGQYVGTSGLPQSVLLQNPVGNGTLSLTSVTASPSSDFAVVNSCGNSVADGGSCAIAVFFDPNASGPRTGVLTVTESASNSPLTVALTGMGEDFSMSSSSASATVSPGQMATYNLTIVSAGGFNQKVTFNCSGAPNLSTCSVSPGSITLSGTSSSTVTVTVTTTARSENLPGVPPVLVIVRMMVLGMTSLLMFATWFGMRRNSGRQLVPFGFALLLLIAVNTTLGCGGSSIHQGSAGTPPGSYNLTATGTFSSGATTLTHNTKLTLNVQ